MPIVLDGTTGVTTPLVAGDALATQAEAQAKTNNTKLMTPLRVKEAIAAIYTYGEDTLSGTSRSATSIPAGLNVVDVILDSASLNGTASFLIQLGTGGVPTTTGYDSMASNFSVTPTSTSGFVANNTAAASAHTFVYRISRVPGTNKWVGMGNGKADGVANFMVASGNGSLSGELDNIRLTTTNGTDTFDAGTWSIVGRV
jgi:hypothetical protein